MTVQKLEKDVVLEILSSPQSYLSDIVRLAGRQSADIIKALEAENARLRVEVGRLEDRLNDNDATYNEVKKEIQMIGRRFKTMTDTILGLTYETPLFLTIFLFFLGVLVLLHITTQLG